jgi:acid phosphatase
MSKSTLKLCAFALFACLLSTQSFSANERLIFALDLVRHGDRTASDDLPAAPHVWAEGEGQLTALGMQQEYQLGLKLHQRYMVDNLLLPTTYQPNTLYIRSTDYDRTIMSAQSLLLGLYAPGTGPAAPNSTQSALPAGFQPIPVHTVAASQDSALLVDLSSRKIADLINKYVYSRPDWKEKSAQLQVQYSRWSELTGVHVSSMFDVLGLGDTLRAYVNHDVALPAGLSNEEVRKIIAESDWIYASLLKPKEVGDVAGKPALQKIVWYLQQAAEQKSKTKFVLISAHDVTTFAVMSALHAPLDTAPTYAADLNFSLYESGSRRYFVKITYNDVPVTVPGCNGNVCTLSQLESLQK